MNTQTSGSREIALRAGASAAREGLRRSQNPHPVQTEDWNNWMDGFDHQTAWLNAGRGTYDPLGAASAADHRPDQSPDT